MIVRVMLVVPSKLITRHNTIVASTFVHGSAIVSAM
jgi:hypothetical protein